MKFSIKDFFSKSDQICGADLVTFTEEILNEKLQFLWSELFPGISHNKYYCLFYVHLC